jgi:hypothetical protein
MSDLSERMRRWADDVENYETVVDDDDRESWNRAVGLEMVDLGLQVFGTEHRFAVIVNSELERLQRDQRRWWKASGLYMPLGFGTLAALWAIAFLPVWWSAAGVSAVTAAMMAWQEWGPPKRDRQEARRRLEAFAADLQMRRIGIF